MAFVLKSATVRIAGVTLSTSMVDVTVSMTAPDVPTTAMGNGGVTRIQGIRDDSFTFNAFSDFAANSIDQTMWPLFSSGTTFLVEVSANPSGSTAISSVNPLYSGTCVMTGSYTPIAGSVGAAAMTPLTLPVSGYISRATA